LLERTIKSPIDKAYTDLKAALLDRGGKVVSESAPNQLVVRQGSLWGASPKTAKKIIKADLSSNESVTNVKCTSRLSSDWKNITIVGCIFAAVLAAICVWIALDLNAFMVSLKPSFWSWLITVDGAADLQVGAAFVNLAKTLAVFLTIVIVFEAAVYVYAGRKIDGFADETLGKLSEAA
jgi:hypothetical protein